jgi:hypothetical protein
VTNNVKERSKGQTAVCISLSKAQLAEIDARAAALNLSRSQYLALVARKDIMRGGPLLIPSPDAAKPPREIDLTAEAIGFLKIAIPALEEYERHREAGTIPEIPEPPESLADSDLWQYFLDERDEILEYKWIESEKERQDIGIDRAIREWLRKHHALWAAAQDSAQVPPSAAPAS